MSTQLSSLHYYILASFDFIPSKESIATLFASQRPPHPKVVPRHVATNRPSHPPARLPSPVTGQPFCTESDVRSPTTTTTPTAETDTYEHYHSSAHDAPIDPVPEPNWSSFVLFDDDDAQMYYPQNPRIKCLRFDKGPGIPPPYCATACVVFPRFSVGIRGLPPSPLRKTALAQEKPARKKAVSFGETIEVLEIDPDTAVEEQAWAHYPEQMKCKDWDGRSPGYEKRRHLRQKMKGWGLRS